MLVAVFGSAVVVALGAVVVLGTCTQVWLLRYRGRRRWAARLWPLVVAVPVRDADTPAAGEVRDLRAVATVKIVSQAAEVARRSEARPRRRRAAMFADDERDDGERCPDVKIRRPARERGRSASIVAAARRERGRPLGED